MLVKSANKSETHAKKERVDNKRIKSKKDAEKQERIEQAKLASVNEADLLLPGSSTDKLTLSDLLNSLNGEGNQVLNTTKLKKQFKKLDKEAQKAPVITAPVSGRKRKRQEMEANYNINAQNLGKYLGQVKRAREQVQSDFTTSDKILHGGGVALNSVA